MDLDLNLLLTFEALDDTRSVSAAAKLLGLSQPATSASLTRLRKALGDELYSFSGGSMQPTSTARRLAPVIRQALADLRKALDSGKLFDPSLDSASFAIGVTDYVSAVIIPTLMATCARTAPGVDLRLSTYNKQELGELIAAGTLDLAIGYFPSPPENVVVTPILEEHFVGVARTDHPALAVELDLPQFANLEHVLFTVGRDGRGVVDHALASQQLSRRVRLAIPHVLALPAILRGTDLVATVPSRAAALFGESISTFDLAFLGLEPWQLHMMWSPFSRRDQAQAWLRALVAAICKSL